MTENTDTNEATEVSQGTTPAAHPDDEISLLDLLIVLAKYKRLVLGLPVAAAALAAMITLLMPDIYTATAKMLPRQQSQSTAAAMLGQYGVPGGTLGIKNSNDQYVGILKSRTVTDSLIQRFDLKKVYDQDTLVGTRKALEKATSVISGKDGIITIEVEDRDPKRAAVLANGYIDELYGLTLTLAVTEASRRRLFFEKQLKIAKEPLEHAEMALKQTQEKTGMIKLDKQGKTIIEAIARLTTQVAAKEVQLNVMQSFATEHNPGYIVTQQELAGLRNQLAKLEQNQPHVKEDVLVPTETVSGVGLEYLRKYRDVIHNETMLELITIQFELAKIDEDEAKDTSLIQVLDKAIEPEKKSKPKRSLIVILTALVAGFAAILWVFIREAGQRSRQNPELASRLEALRGYLRWR